MKSSRFLSLVAATFAVTCLFCSCEKSKDLTYGSSYEDNVIAIEPYIYTTDYHKFKQLGYYLTNKTSDKTVKYFTIYGSLCDHWGTELYSQIDGKILLANIKAVGPIEPGETCYYEQNEYIITSAAEQVLIKAVSVEYTDGSIYHLR